MSTEHLSTLETLPNELLLKISKNLADDLPALTSFALVSKTFRPLVEDVLYRKVILSQKTGSARFFKFLRTILRRPELGRRVDHLVVFAVRKNIFHLPTSLGTVDLDVKDLCLAKLQEWGYSQDDPWARMVQAGIQSAFAGIILGMSTNPRFLELAIVDSPNHGDTCSPDAVLSLLRNSYVSVSAGGGPTSCEPSCHSWITPPAFINGSRTSLALLPFMISR